MDKWADLQEQSGINYTEMSLESTYAIGGELDATGWRARLALLANQIDEHHGLGYKLAEASSDKKPEALKELFERNPSAAMHFFSNKVKDILRREGVADNEMYGENSVWNRLQRSLGSLEIELAYNQQYGRPPNLPAQPGQPARLYVPGQNGIPSYEQLFLDTGLFQTEASTFARYTRAIVAGVTEQQFLNDASQIEWAFTTIISDIDWSNTSFITLGQIEHNRRIRDISGKVKASNAELGILNDPSPFNQEDYWKHMKEIQEGMQEYLGKENPNTNARLYRNLYAYMEFNRDQLEWLPLQREIGKLLPASWVKPVGGLPKSFSEVMRVIFPFASTAQSRKGPHAPAMNTFARNTFIDMAMRHELLTDMRLYDKLRSQEKAHFGWQAAYFLYWAIPILMVSTAVLAAKKSTEEESK